MPVRTVIRKRVLVRLAENDLGEFGFRETFVHHSAPNSPIGPNSPRKKVKIDVLVSEYTWQDEVTEAIGNRARG